MNEALETEGGHGVVNRSNVLERILAREHHTLYAELAQHGGSGRVVDRHLGRSVDLELREDAADQRHQTEILHDHRVDTAVHRFIEEGEGLAQFMGLHENIEREIDTPSARVREETRCLELVQGELGSLVSSVETLGAQIHRVSPVRDRCASGVERAGRGEQLGYAARDHKSWNVRAYRP